jgi:hypothetical protein
MHDSCSPLNDPIKQGDTWLSQQVPLILNSAAYKNGGALLITWDEGENGSDGPIGMIVLSPAARGHGYSNTIYYTHSSTLRTMEEIFGVSPWLGMPRMPPTCVTSSLRSRRRGRVHRVGRLQPGCCSER